MRKNTVSQPIFFIGMPRSGSSIIQEAFSAHESLGWLSNYTARFPGSPRVTLIHRLFGGRHGQRNQGQSLAIYNRLLPRPSESYAVWLRLFGPRFLFSCLDGVEATDGEVSCARAYIGKLLSAQGKQRFCAKLTGPPRIKFLSRIFPDACFIDIIRDPRAVVASLIVDKDQFWESKGGLEKPFWDGALDDFGKEQWDASGRMPVVLAAAQWAALYEQTKREVAATGIRYKQVRYETFIQEPVGIMADLVEFCNLVRSAQIDAYLNGVRYDSRNDKFSELFTEHELAWLERVTASQLDALGYRQTVALLPAGLETG